LELVVDVEDTSTSGNVIKKTNRNELIEKAIQMYNQIL
jgi:hypothetical protein